MASTPEGFKHANANLIPALCNGMKILDDLVLGGEFGRTDWNRTSDLCHVKAAL
jgi:hypothetical protein